MIKILWAEDDPTAFEEYRQILHEMLSAKGFQHEIIHAVDGNEVYRYLGLETSIDILVVDIEMPNWNGFETARDIATRFMGLPIIVVSTHVHASEIRNQLDKMIEEHILNGYFHSADSSGWCEAIIKTLESGPITILHLSDIHFGRFYGLQRATVGLENLIFSQFGQILGATKVDLLVVSGDFCSEGLTKEFQQACNFLNSIIDYFSITRKRVILVPGNHDIYRNEEEERRFTKFIEFINAFYSSPEDGLQHYPELFDPTRGKLRDEGLNGNSIFNVAVFDDLKLTVIGLNSVIAREQGWNHGEIDGSQLIKIQAELVNLRPPRRDFLRIAVFHHHLFEVPSIYQPESENRVVLNQGMILRHLIRHKIRFVLHGHSHYGAGHRYLPYFFDETMRTAQPIHVFSTGTLSGAHRATAQYSYQCNIIQLLREERAIVKGVVTPLRLIDDSLEWRSLQPIEFNLL